MYLLVAVFPSSGEYRQAETSSKLLYRREHVKNYRYTLTVKFFQVRINQTRKASLLNTIAADFFFLCTETRKRFFVPVKMRNGNDKNSFSTINRWAITNKSTRKRFHCEKLKRLVFTSTRAIGMKKKKVNC